ncbi:MAG TPA: YitT family protein, partial [Aggregatilineales bacterium]|nr:YitT family protein [Aggregatilineales bacterium]
MKASSDSASKNPTQRDALTQDNRRAFVSIAVRALVILCGEIVNVFAYRSLIVPSKLLSGGVVGTSLLLNQLFALPIGAMTILLNIPIFILGYRYLGRRFIILSAVGVGSFSTLMDNISLPSLTH